MSVATEVRLPKVGDRVIAKFIPGITGIPAYNESGDVVMTGQTVTVTRVEPNDNRRERVVGTDETTASPVDGPTAWAEFYRGPDRGTALLYFTEWEFIDDTTSEPELTDEQQEIATLKARIVDLIGQNNTALEHFDSLCDIAIEVADSKGLCHQYDDFVKAANQVAERRGLSLRFKERETSHSIEVRIEATQVAYYTVFVDGTSYEDAVERLHEDPDSYFDMQAILTDEVTSCGWDDITFDTV